MSKENFFPNEFDLYNALSSKKQKITKEFLITELRKKGILISSSLTREEIIDLYSKLTISFSECDNLMLRMQSEGKKDKWGVKQIVVDENFDLNEFKEIFDNETTTPDEKANIYAEGENKYICDYVYSEFDLSKNPMFQKVKREAIIEISLEGNKLNLRFNSNDRMKKKLKNVKKIIEKQTKNTPEEIEIDFSTFPKITILTDFLIRLIENIEGYNVVNVKNVKLNFPKVKLEDDDKEDLDDEDENTTENTEIGSQILKAIFGGESLLVSPRYKDFIANGYYLSSIVWQLEKSKTIDEEKFEVEALFQDTTNGTNFIYNSRYKYSYNKEQRQYNESHIFLEEEEQKDLNKKIEEAAIKIYLDLLKEKGISHE